MYGVVSNITEPLLCHSDGATMNKSVVHKKELDKYKGVHYIGFSLCLDRGKAQEQKCSLKAIEESTAEACY